MGMDWFPDEPPLPPEQRAVGPSSLRYEDVSQDGRLMLLALPHSIGDVVWQKLLVHHPSQALSRGGVIPILTRFVIEGGDGPVGVRGPLSATGCFQLAQSLVPGGGIKHLHLNLWTHVTAPRGRTYGPPPERAGEQDFVGRVFAEHVWTRLFAAAGERAVTRFDAPGLPPLPPDVWKVRPFEAALEAPAGTRFLDGEPVLDPAEIVFGLGHTDSNQHVNSLVYPRLFHDAALRRMASHGLPTQVLARRLEIAYRKPCFAGQRMRIALRAFEGEGRFGASGSFVADDGRPYNFVQMIFTR
jgi:hypothetical protein